MPQFNYTFVLYLVLSFFFFLSSNAKERVKIITYETVAIALCMVYFYILGRPLSVMVDILFIVVNVTSLLMTKDKRWKWLLIALAPFIAYLTLASYKDYLDLFVLGTVVLSLYAKSILNLQHIRLLLGGACFLWVCYFLLMGLYFEASLNMIFTLNFIRLMLSKEKSKLLNEELAETVAA